MNIFAFDENVSRKQKKILARVRCLMNGETSQMLSESGFKYKKIYGVSLVHLRKLATEFEPDNKLAERLWYQGFRETMILATMLADRELLTEKQINEWAGEITNIELAEQMAFNLLGKRGNIKPVVDRWLSHSEIYVCYSALMSIGWNFRFSGSELGDYVKDNYPLLELLAVEPLLAKGIFHCLKMMGRFDVCLHDSVVQLASKWRDNHEYQLKMIGENVLFEFGLDDLVEGERYWVNYVKYKTF